MKQMIHCCFTSHGEVMFRDVEDISFFINALASTAWKYGIEIYADTEMSNHVHLMLMASDQKRNVLYSGAAGNILEKDGFNRNGSVLYSSGNQLSLFVSTLRKRISRQFNLKYSRKEQGRLGEKAYYSINVAGNYHMISACSYVLRNPMHHGVTGTPFAYPYSSVNDMFVQELGKTGIPYVGSAAQTSYHRNMQGKWTKKCRQDKSSGSGYNLIFPPGYSPIVGRNAIRHRLPRNTEFPDEWVMSPDGTFLRPCFEELRQTEMLFVSPASFQFNMLRKTDEKWLLEQNQDSNSQSIIGLDAIEPMYSRSDIETFLMNERGASFKRSFNDFDVCRIIDHDILPEFKCSSIYQLSESQRTQIRQILVNDIHVPTWQAVRCV